MLNNIQGLSRNMLELNRESLRKTIFESTVPAIIDFWASWCHPCQRMAPVFEKLAVDYNGKLLFAKVSIEKNEDVAADYDIRGIPCFIIFNAGQEAGRIVGSMPEKEFKEKIDGIIGRV